MRTNLIPSIWYCNDMVRRTTGSVARDLGTSVPRVHRALRELGLTPDQTAGGHLRLSPTEVARVRRRLGRVVAVEGLGREEVLTLAALSRRPLGLRSARAVARAAGISHGASTAALSRLEGMGCVMRKPRLVVEGCARSITEWEVCFLSPQWRRVASAISRVEVPRTDPRASKPAFLPRRFGHLFWDVPHPEQIDLRVKGATVAHRMLTSSDPRAHAWAATMLPAKDLRRAATYRGVSERVQALAENLARA
jgi:hypothetical protein